MKITNITLDLRTPDNQSTIDRLSNIGWEKPVQTLKVYSKSFGKCKYMANHNVNKTQNLSWITLSTINVSDVYEDMLLGDSNTQIKTIADIKEPLIDISNNTTLEVLSIEINIHIPYDNIIKALTNSGWLQLAPNYPIHEKVIGKHKCIVRKKQHTNKIALNVYHNNYDMKKSRFRGEGNDIGIMSLQDISKPLIEIANAKVTNPALKCMG